MKCQIGLDIRRAVQNGAGAGRRRISQLAIVPVVIERSAGQIEDSSPIQTFDLPIGGRNIGNAIVKRANFHSRLGVNGLNGVNGVVCSRDVHANRIQNQSSASNKGPTTERIRAAQRQGRRRRSVDRQSLRADNRQVKRNVRPGRVHGHGRRRAIQGQNAAGIGTDGITSRVKGEVVRRNGSADGDRPDSGGTKNRIVIINPSGGQRPVRTRPVPE